MALRQDGHPAADLLHHLHLVGDDDHRDAEGTVQLLEQGQDGLGSGGVQGGGGLVTEEHLGVRGESPCDGHPLLLAAGELGGIGALPVLQAHDLQEFPGPGDGFLPGRAGELQREADVVQGAALHQQVEALKDHGDGLPGLAQLLGGEGGDLLPVHPDGALRGGLQQVHAADQRALSGTGEADDAVDLSLFNAQVDAIQRGDGGLALAEGLSQTPDLNDGLAHRISPLNLCGHKKTPLTLALKHQGRSLLRGTTLLRPDLAVRTFPSADTLSRDHGRPRRSLCTFLCGRCATPRPCSLRPSVPVFTLRALFAVPPQVLFSSSSLLCCSVVERSIIQIPDFVNREF